MKGVNKDKRKNVQTLNDRQKMAIVTFSNTMIKTTWFKVKLIIKYQ